MITTTTPIDEPCPGCEHAEGTDQLADDVARRCGWTPPCHPADGNRDGRCAGLRRTADRVASRADVRLAFIQNDSRAASDTAALAEPTGILVRRYEHRTPR